MKVVLELHAKNKYEALSVITMIKEMIDDGCTDDINDEINLEVQVINEGDMKNNVPM